MLWDGEFGCSLTHKKIFYNLCAFLEYLYHSLHECMPLSLLKNKIGREQILLVQIDMLTLDKDMAMRYEENKICLYFGVFACGYYGQHRKEYLMS